MESQNETPKPNDYFSGLTDPRLKRVGNLAVALGAACKTIPNLTAVDITMAGLMLASFACLRNLPENICHDLMSEESREIGQVGGMMVVTTGLAAVAHVLIGLRDALQSEAQEVDEHMAKDTVPATPATPEMINELIEKLSKMTRHDVA